MPGEQCVMITGIQLMHELSVDNWAILLAMLQLLLMLILVQEVDLLLWTMCSAMDMNLPCLAVHIAVPMTVAIMKMPVLDVVTLQLLPLPQVGVLQLQLLLLHQLIHLVSHNLYHILYGNYVLVICSHGNIRLVGGSNIYEGRVEVCVNNQWGTICDDSWGTNDAQVVCRQLGYSTSNVTAFNNAYFGQGTGPIHLDDLSCVGTESSLFSCTYSSTHNCVHSEDAGVSCSSSSSTTSSDSSTFGVIFAVIINFVFFAGCYGFCICLCVCMYQTIKKRRKASHQLGNTPSYTYQRNTSSYPHQQYTSPVVLPSTIPTLPTIPAALTVPTAPTVRTVPTVPTVPTFMPLEPPAYDTSWSQMYNPPNTIELQSMAADSEDPPPYSEAYKYAEAHQL